MSSSSIEWTDTVWNVLRGCSRVSAGCGDSTGGGCYAERQAFRFSGEGQPYEGLVRLTTKGPRWTGEVRFVTEKLAEPLTWRKPRRVFVNSMSDLFHESLTNEQIAAVFGVMASAPMHTFQVLTKRPARMREWFASRVGLESMEETVAREAAHLARIVWDSRGSEPWKYPDGVERPNRRAWPGWPLPNVWLGVSVEDQESANARIPSLLHTPATVRWVSYEPAIGPVDFTGIGRHGFSRGEDYYDATAGLDWIVVGGESGPGARPFDLAWARSVIEQTRMTRCRVFVKQLGARPIATCSRCRGDGIDPVRVGHDPDWCAECGGSAPCTESGPVVLRDRKGGDPSEWPADLRVREWPEVRR